MFDKKQKSCVKRTHLVTDNDGLYDRKAFKSKQYFLFTLDEWWRIYQL